ncbi:hypothetical protein Pcinc_035338 [Petrolisthes cinctipes]|uniref:Uncharacterized protein n=1 Tax=Petrolisthes cinctipes TaxID=88211 RepID=A0AAE1C039_PETCI|nr:hypothetical protein Pcinc_035338 [Petrolisthes cinctipes]
MGDRMDEGGGCIVDEGGILDAVVAGVRWVDEGVRWVYEGVNTEVVVAVWADEGVRWVDEDVRLFHSGAFSRYGGAVHVLHVLPSPHLSLRPLCHLPGLLLVPNVFQCEFRRVWLRGGVWLLLPSTALHTSATSPHYIYLIEHVYVSKQFVSVSFVIVEVVSAGQLCVGIAGVSSRLSSPLLLTHQCQCDTLQP